MIALQIEHPAVLLVAAAVFAPPLLALGPVIVSGVHRVIASGPVLMVVIIAAIVVPEIHCYYVLLSRVSSETVHCCVDPTLVILILYQPYCRSNNLLRTVMRSISSLIGSSVVPGFGS